MIFVLAVLKIKCLKGQNKSTYYALSVHVQNIYLCKISIYLGLLVSTFCSMHIETLPTSINCF